MTISLTGPTAATTTTDGKLSASTVSFVSDNTNDLRSKVFSVSAIVGAALASKHTVDAPKQVIFKRPANYAVPSAYNTVTGRYGKVPKNVHRVTGRGSCQVATGQWESMPMTLDIGIPAGAPAFDPANVELSYIMLIGALWDQREEICQAFIDGMY